MTSCMPRKCSCMPRKCSWTHLEMLPRVGVKRIKLTSFMMSYAHNADAKLKERDLLFQALAAITAKLQVALEDPKGPTPIEALSKLPLERLQVVQKRSLQVLKPWQFKGNVNQVKDATRILGISLKHFTEFRESKMNPSNSSLAARRQITYISVVAPDLGLFSLPYDTYQQL